MNANILKIVGLAATLVSFGADAVMKKVADKQLDAKIAVKVAEALANAKEV